MLPRELSKPDVDREASTCWLTEGKATSEAQARVVEAQDGVVSTRAYEVTIGK